MKKTLTTFGAAFLLASCMTAEERARQDAAYAAEQCTGMGYAEHTPAFSDCRLKVSASRADRAPALLTTSYDRCPHPGYYC